jgi:hypothetical protein
MQRRAPLGAARCVALDLNALPNHRPPPCIRLRPAGFAIDSSASHQASLLGTSDALNIAAHAGQHATCCPGSRLAMAVHMGVAARQKQQFS